MSVETNKKSVRRFFEEVLDGGNGALLHELFTPQAARHFPGIEYLVEASSPPRSGPLAG